MIEYGQLTKLDDDYITVISDYLLYEDKERVIDNITKLAELGQINAIQTYYILDGKFNERIEKYIKNIFENKPKNFNEKLALARYYRNIDIEKNSDKLNELVNDYDQLIEKLCVPMGRGVAKDTDVEKSLLGILDKIANFPSIKYELLTMESIKKLTYKTAKMQEVYIELHDSSIYYHTNEDTLKKRDIKKVRKALLLDVKNSYNDVASKYYLAKNIARFGGNKKEIQLGRKLLLELSNRYLSINNIKTVEEKQVDNKANNIEKINSIKS